MYNADRSTTCTEADWRFEEITWIRTHPVDFVHKDEINIIELIKYNKNTSMAE